MSKPYSVTLHIAEKNCKKDDLDKLISILKDEHSFNFFGSSFSSDKTHQGTTMIKPVSGDDAKSVLDGVKNEIEKIETKTMVRFNCQLTVSASDVETDTIFIK